MVRDRIAFPPLGEVVRYDKNKFIPPRSQRKWPKYIHGMRSIAAPTTYLFNWERFFLPQLFGSTLILSSDPLLSAHLLQTLVNHTCVALIG